MSPAPPIIFDRRANAYALKSGPKDRCKRFEDLWTVSGAENDLERCGLLTKGGMIAPGVLERVVPLSRTLGVVV